MRANQAFVRWGARAGVAAAGAAVAAIALTAASVVPWPQLTFAAPSTVVAPVPTQQSRVCAGPLLALAADAGDATSALTIGAADTVARGESATPAQRDLAMVGGHSFDGDGAPIVVSESVPADAEVAPALGASQSQLAMTEEVSGLAAAACDEAAADSWIVAGSTSLGQTSLLMLGNPTEVEARVQLTMYGPNGLAGDPTIVAVAAGTQTMVPLAGLGADLDATAVHVQATGGQVTAVMQQSWVSGLTPEGVEFAGATAAPATSQTIPGISVRGIDAVKQIAGADGYAASLPALRVLAPGSDDASVSVSVAPIGSSGAGTTWQGRIGANTVVEVPLDGLTDGDYTATVTSDVPIVTAARTSTMAGEQRDFAWFEASTPLTGDSIVPVTGPATLRLANPSTDAVTVTLSAPRGDAEGQRFEIRAGEAIAVPLAERGGYRLTDGKGVLAAVTYTSQGVLASFTVGSAASLAGPLTVYPR